MLSADKLWLWDSTPVSAYMHTVLKLILYNITDGEFSDTTEALWTASNS